jgi:hypothetical protein
MKYDEVSERLLNEMPEFQPGESDPDSPYITAGRFAHFLLEMYRQENMDALSRGLSFIERLYESDDRQVRELAVIGYLEGLQNVWSNRGTDPESIFPLLGENSRQWWIELNEFWSGRTKYVGQSQR